MARGMRGFLVGTGESRLGPAAGTSGRGAGARVPFPSDLKCRPMAGPSEAAHGGFWLEMPSGWCDVQTSFLGCWFSIFENVMCAEQCTSGS